MYLWLPLSACQDTNEEFNENICNAKKALIRNALNVYVVKIESFVHHKQTHRVPKWPTLTIIHGTHLWNVALILSCASAQ